MQHKVVHSSSKGIKGGLIGKFLSTLSLKLYRNREYADVFFVRLQILVLSAVFSPEDFLICVSPITTFH